MTGGLVLNITLDDPKPGTPKSRNPKNGRPGAERVSKRKDRPDETTSQNLGQVSDAIKIRPAKRLRREGECANRSRSDVSPSKHPPQFISSLFTYNPAIYIPKEPAAPRNNLKPSNAPVDASTFEDLGLSPLLVSHLSAKMAIIQPTSIQRAVLTSLLQTSEARDVFIQSQTGSGKTLSFLLPIIQDLLPLSSFSYIDRSIGTLAVIIAPTRELAKQISDVLDTILTLRLRPPSDEYNNMSPDLSSQRLTRWLVSGSLTGGATRTHEKARLRKGIPILVSTPGRLLDHLQNTSAFNVGKCRWLVLDEADRLMDLGFEETLRGILKSLDGRRKLALQAEEEGTSTKMSRWEWKKRRNILCSATIREDVQKLAGVALDSPMVIKASDFSRSNLSTLDVTLSENALVSGQKFAPPSQLAQNYVTVPLKWRLVTLVALLRHLLAQTAETTRKGCKIIVFFSCTDSVDFHWALLGGANMDEGEGSSDFTKISGSDSKGQDVKVGHSPSSHEQIQVTSTLLPNTSIYRLHGSLPLQNRLACLRAFSSKQTSSNKFSILLCTSVASRGLDLPLVRAVIQHDLPTEGGATEYVHRVGRTARVGAGGEAWAFVGPSEEAWVPWIEERLGNDDDKEVRLRSVGAETVLRHGFGGKGKEYEARATQVQISFERWVLRSLDHAELARKAYLSHMRAYATHPSDEKHIFLVRHLHLGHLAKAFALREAPSAIVRKSGKAVHEVGRKLRKNGKTTPIRSENKERRDRTENAGQRMMAVVRSQGRLSKKDGVMRTSGASEFQIAGSDVLETLTHQ